MDPNQTGGGTDPLLPGFVARFGAPAPAMPATPEALSQVPAGFPQAVLQLWRQQGFGAYADGLIWTHAPRDFAGVLKDWTGKAPDAVTLLVRFSFGSFAMWMDGRIFFVNVHRGFAEEIPEDPGFLFDDMLCDDEFLDTFACRSLHLECTRRFGPVAAGECFGFMPPLASGGALSSETVRKVPLHQHLTRLAHLHGPLTLR